MIGNVNGKTDAGETGGAQSIVGSQDVALMKYDSAGNLLYSQVLGSSISASGYGLAVSANGQVAVTGAAQGLVTGTGTSSSATISTGFVSLYSDQGQPLWTNTIGDGSPGQVNNAAFGSDGSVYVTGSTSIAGTTITNNYLAGFSAAGVQTFSTSLGSNSQTQVTGLAVSGSQIVTAGTQNGDAVVNSYAIQSNSAPTLSAPCRAARLQALRSIPTARSSSPARPTTER